MLGNLPSVYVESDPEVTWRATSIYLQEEVRRGRLDPNLAAYRAILEAARLFAGISAQYYERGSRMRCRTKGCRELLRHPRDLLIAYRLPVFTEAVPTAHDRS